jgi:hypothetical protein
VVNKILEASLGLTTRQVLTRLHSRFRYGAVVTNLPSIELFRASPSIPLAHHDIHRALPLP